ncbi:MAG TPA: hypothetical protein VIN09_02390 [Chloroflexota bacterium]
MRAVALVQGLYYLVTGLWAVVSVQSFQKVTGPKTDIWLVKTVGVLVAVIGGVLALWSRRPAGLPVPLLGVGSALGLATIDTTYSLRGRIRPIYLLDALLEIAIVAWWARAAAGALGWPVLQIGSDDDSRR